MRDGFITHVHSYAEVKETVTRRHEKLRSLSETLQPFIVIVGESLDKISSYFVVIDEVYYKVGSILESVDYCFKAILALNVKYPVEACGVWYLIQKGFYEITTPYDKGYTSVCVLLSALGVSETE